MTMIHVEDMSLTQEVSHINNVGVKATQHHYRYKIRHHIYDNIMEKVNVMNIKIKGRSPRKRHFP